jgi:hypothetical protein
VIRKRNVLGHLPNFSINANRITRRDAHGFTDLLQAQTIWLDFHSLEFLRGVAGRCHSHVSVRQVSIEGKGNLMSDEMAVTVASLAAWAPVRVSTG